MSFNNKIMNNDEQRSKEDKARELAASICTRITLKPVTVGMWGAGYLYWWLVAMGYEWNGESWQKSS